ncbi:hypothetical protein BKA70DRAFT_1235645 [Coprinopsis sp. MPI-PUGE-AT-0042]|nr:hypothetical protein BKA70DRAFT_1235645 [Coprinopsis sp. MPI-PUGE-AT-0042]
MLEIIYEEQGHGTYLASTSLPIFASLLAIYVIRMSSDMRSDDNLPPETGYTFTPSQQSYMWEKVEGYNACTSKKRNKYSKQVAEHLTKEVETHSKQSLSKQEHRESLAATWFKHHSDPAKREKGIWSGKWHTHRVFMKLNGAQIVALADKMVDGDVDLGEFLKEWEENPVDVSEIEKRGRNPKKKVKKGEEGDWFFNHYQDAATLLMKNMDEGERERYTALAEKWNSTGPLPSPMGRP